MFPEYACNKILKHLKKLLFWAPSIPSVLHVFSLFNVYICVIEKILIPIIHARKKIYKFQSFFQKYDKIMPKFQTIFYLY